MEKSQCSGVSKTDGNALFGALQLADLFGSANDDGPFLKWGGDAPDKIATPDAWV